MRIGLFGDGRLGQAVAATAQAASDVELAWVAGPGEFPDEPVDAAVDASVASGVADHVAWAVEAGTPLAIGATGWELPDLAARVGQRTAVLAATNFSLTVALLARFATILGAYSELDPGRDTFVAEHHHRLKADAPSGTAITLAEAVLAGSTRKRAWVLQPPNADQLQIAVLRAGSEFGHHVVGFDSPAETLELSHRARSRAPFADGALIACRWLQGRTGLFTMADLAADILDPLFSQEPA